MVGGHTLIDEAWPAIMSRSGPWPNCRNAIVRPPTGTVRIGPRKATSPVRMVPESSFDSGRGAVATVVEALVAGVVDLVSLDPDEQAATTITATKTTGPAVQSLTRMSPVLTGVARPGAIPRIAKSVGPTRRGGGPLAPAAALLQLDRHLVLHPRRCVLR